MAVTSAWSDEDSMVLQLSSLKITIIIHSGITLIHHQGFLQLLGKASLPNRWRTNLIIRRKAMYGDQAHIQVQFTRGACLWTPVDTHMPTLRTEPLPSSFNPGWNTDHKMLTGSMSISVPGCDPQVESEHPYRQRVGSIWQPCRVTPPQVIVLKQEKNNALHYSNT